MPDAKKNPEYTNKDGPHLLVGPILIAVLELLVGVVAAAVFEDPADQGNDGQATGHVGYPETYGQAEESTCTREAKNQGHQLQGLK